MTDRKKPGVAFWATVVVVAVLVGYPLSYGPVPMLAGYGGPAAWDAIVCFYRPIDWIAYHTNIGRPLYEWRMLWLKILGNRTPIDQSDETDLLKRDD